MNTEVRARAADTFIGERENASARASRMLAMKLSTRPEEEGGCIDRGMVKMKAMVLGAWQWQNKSNIRRGVRLIIDRTSPNCIPGMNQVCF